ncbi:DUF4349 domain-containing protein [Brevibacillus ginsengisoli]|uniref:DUF4349 domain-containing protein n=1 Tax=Brevibacillus ginsengisoli TaxID=363854 RepID=UPI003CE99968
MLKYQKWKMIFLAIQLVLLLLLFGCSSARPTDHSASSYGGANSNSMNQTASMADKTAEAPALPQEQSEGSASNANSPNTTNNQTGIGNPPMQDRKMIYQADLQMEVEKYKEARSNIEASVKRNHGYILSSSDYENENEKGGHLTVRIPQSGFHSFLNELDQYAIKIPSRNIVGQDVTEEYVDLTSRLKALQVVEARLLNFMSEAKKTEDLLKISTELGATQQEIEKIKGRMRYLDENISYSTVEMTIVEKKFTAKLNDVGGQGTWHKAWIALNQSLLGILAFLNGLIVVIAAILPILVLLAIVGIPGYLFWKKKKRQQ